MPRTTNRIAVSLAALAATAAIAQPTAYVTDDDDGLYRLDLATLQTEYIGQIGAQHVYDIAALSDGTIAGQHDADPGYFLADSADAGLLAQADNNASSGFMGDLDELGNRLFAYRNGVLNEIDPITGERSTLAVRAVPNSVRSLAMVTDSEAYIYAHGAGGVREIYRVDFGSGTADLVWDTVDNSLNFQSIDYANGTLYTMTSDGELSTLDVSTGTFDALGQIAIASFGSFTITPAPGTAGVLSLAGLLAARRRR